MRTTRGFSLIEAVLVILLLSIASVPVLNLFSQAARAWMIDEDLQTATQLVQARAEAVLANRRNGTYADIALGTTTEALTGAYSGYNRTTEITAHAGSPCPTTACKQVTVTLSRSGSTLATLRFLVADY